MVKEKVIFFDRDGILNVDYGYVCDPEKFEFVEGIIETLKYLQKNYKFIIVTNQGGIAKGMYTFEQMSEMNEYLLEKYNQQGIKFEKVYYCSHHPDEKCSCRKPESGMFEQAMKDFDIDVSQSWTIGDKETDCIAGKKVGTKTILLKSKYTDDKENSPHVDYLIENLIEIKNLI